MCVQVVGQRGDRSPRLLQSQTQEEVLEAHYYHFPSKRWT